MKKYIILLTIICFTRANAQFQELGFGVGTAAYLGDLNSGNNKTIVDQFTEGYRPKNVRLSLSLNYRYNFEKMFSLGFSYYHMNLAGYDSDNPTPVGYDAAFYRKNRNLSFHTAINQGFVDARIEPFRTPKSWTSGKMHISPYASLGFGFFKFNPKTMYNGQEYELQPLGTEGQGLPGYNAPYSLFEIGVPLGLGIRVTDKNRKYAISLDFNNTFTFTDYIDDVSSYYVNPAIVRANNDPAKAALINALGNRSTFPSGFTEVTYYDQKRGNSDYNDYFTTTQLKFSYYFQTGSGSSNAYYKCCGF
jgi:Domain of unknown function (DUF6089)